MSHRKFMDVSYCKEISKAGPISINFSVSSFFKWKFLPLDIFKDKNNFLELCIHWADRCWDSPNYFCSANRQSWECYQQMWAAGRKLFQSLCLRTAGGFCQVKFADKSPRVCFSWHLNYTRMTHQQLRLQLQDSRFLFFKISSGNYSCPA